jgi:hypothetical protein
LKAIERAHAAGQIDASLHLEIPEPPRFLVIDPA